MENNYEALLKERNALREENGKLTALLDECRNAITKISNEEKEKEIKAKSQQMISQLGLGMDADKLFYKRINILIRYK